MFEFTSTTIINANKDVNSGLKKFFYDGDCERLVVRGVNSFIPDCITKVYKRVANIGTPGKAQLTIPTTGVEVGDVLKFRTYLRLSGSQSSFFANVWVFKGKPLDFEFAVKDTSKMAEEAAKVIKKNQAYFGDKWISVEGTGNVLTVSGLNEFEKITEVEVAKYVANTGETWSTAYGAQDPNGGWKVLKSVNITDNAVAVADTFSADGIMPNVNGFGTYDQIIKDLRLPTQEHTNWKAAGQDELPEASGLYDQYTIVYEKDRGIMGGDAVGEITKSRTNHILWVKQGTDIETVLTAAGITPEVYNAEYKGLTPQREGHEEAIADAED